MPRDQGIVECLSPLGHPAGDGADRFDHRHVALVELAQQPVLGGREVAGQLLDRVERTAVGDELDDVAMQTLHRCDQPRIVPVIEPRSPTAARRTWGVRDEW